MLAGTMLLSSGLQASAAGLRDVFDAEYYANSYKDLKEAFGTDEEALYKHFLEYGLKESRVMNPVLDVAAYRGKYEDLDKAFGDNWDAYVDHYFTYGVNENRDNGTDFDLKKYKAAYEDLREELGEEDNFLFAKHYLEFGQDENRVKGDKSYEEPKPAASQEAVTAPLYPSTIYEYDANGNVIKEIYYDEDGSVSATNEYTYDENGRKSMKKSYEADGTWNHTSYYTWGADGKLETEQVVTRWGRKSVHVYDDNGCHKAIEVNVPTPEKIEAIFAITNVTVKDANNGKLSIENISGGTKPYTILWYDSNDNEIPNTKNLYLLTGLAKDTYKVQVTDVNGCTSEKYELVIGDNGSLDAEVTSDPIKCYGEATGVINVMIKNGKRPFDIYVDDKLVQEDSPGGTLLMLEGYAFGTYRVRIEDVDGGKYETDIEVAYDGVSAPLEMTLSSNTTPICYGSSDGFIGVKVQGGKTETDNGTEYYKTLTISPGAIKLEGATRPSTEYSTNNQNAPKPLAAGTYIVTVTDYNGCQVSDEIEIVQYEEIKIENAVVTDVTCAGAKDGKITNTVSGGNGSFTYKWEVKDGANWKDIQGTVTSDINLEGVEGNKTYRLTVTDGNSCTATAEYFVKEPQALTYKVTHEDVKSCDANASEGVITLEVKYGTAPYLITLDGAEPVSTAGYYRFENVAVGTRSINIVDANGCSSFVDANGDPLLNPITVEIKKYDDMSLSITEYVMDDSENGLGSVKFDLSGGVKDNASSSRYEIVLSSDNVPGFNTRVVSNLVSGATQQNDIQKCKATWNNDKFEVEFTDLEPGRYVVSVRDMNASHPTCVAVDEFEFDKLRIVSENVKVPFCSGIKNGEISISVDGNHGNLTYRWLKYNETNNTFDPLTNQSSNALSALEAGKYMVEVFDGAEDDITNGFSNTTPHISVLISISSISLILYFFKYPVEGSI